MSINRTPGVCYCDGDPPCGPRNQCPENPPTHRQILQLMDTIDAMKQAMRRAHEYAVTGAAGFAAGSLETFVSPYGPKADLNADLVELQRVACEALRAESHTKLKLERYRRLNEDLARQLLEMIRTIRYATDDRNFPTAEPAPAVDPEPPVSVALGWETCDNCDKFLHQCTCKRRG